MEVFGIFLLVIITTILINIYYSNEQKNETKRNQFFSNYQKTDEATKELIISNVFGVSKFRNYSVSLPYKTDKVTISDYSVLVTSGYMAFSFKGSFYTLKLNDDKSFIYIVIKGTPDGFINDKNYEYLDVYECTVVPIYHVHIYYKGEHRPSCELIKELLSISYDSNINILINNGYLTIFEKPGFFKSHYATEDIYNKILTISSEISNAVEE